VVELKINKKILKLLIFILLVSLLSIPEISFFAFILLILYLSIIITYGWEEHEQGKIETPGKRIGLGLVSFYRTSLSYLYRKTFPGREKVEGSS